MSDLKFGEITEKMIGAAMRVHNTLGCGFQEVIYQRALELDVRLIPVNYVREFEMPIFYLDQPIGLRRVDFFVENKISVE
jgi:GxxExxY protein